MMFPHRSIVRAAAIAAAAGLTAVAIGAPSAAADEPAPPLHRVKYSVFSETPFRNAEIYYRDVDPPTFADYSHNPYLYSPNVEFDTGPNQMWTLDVMLANPDEWAMVTVGSLDSPQRPNFHCVLAVDDKVVVTNQGPKGALCSIRHW
jgi:hypothetical protein